MLGLQLLSGAQARAAVFCTAAESKPNTTVVALASENAAVWGIKDVSSPLPWPAEGVVTGWQVPLGSAKGGLEQRLQVFRPLGPTTFLLAAETPGRVVSGTRGFFRTRIPIEKGDLFGLRGTVETYTCGWIVGVTSGLFEGPTQVGSTYELRPKAELGLPLRVAVETDLDGDGYGDESQDRCTRVATTQDDCPAVNLRAKATVRERSILLSITVDTKAKVGASAELRLRVGLPGKKPAVQHLYLLGSRRDVLPGRTTRLRIKLPEPVRQRLDELPSHKSPTARITMTAISVAGRAVERELRVQLPGRARP